MKPSLHIHVYSHSSSQDGRRLADDLIDDWMGRPAVQGLRIPVFLGRLDEEKVPLHLDLDKAQHSLVVLLVDAWMTNRVDGEGAEWAEWATKIISANPPGGRHGVIPVALSREAYEWDQQLSRSHFLSLHRVADSEERRARLGFTLAVRALHLLGRSNPQPERPEQAPVTLFVSHAKRDLEEENRDPVRSTQDALRDLPVREWFDAREIREGANFEQEIRRGIERADAMLVFLTDAWATRPWCRTEALIAKELGTPIVVVDALADGEPRSFPYGGNTRLLRWRAPIRPPEDAVEERVWRQRSLAEGARVVAAGVREALRRLHSKQNLESLAQPGDVVLDCAPEPARLGWEEPSATFLYPDPPLGREEQRLLERIWPDSLFETPMIRMVRRRSGQPPFALAVSISESPDLRRFGLTKRHQRHMTDEVYLYLMLAGLQIVYGGELDPEAMDDPDNFTLRLFELARGYSSLGQDVGAVMSPIRNVVPWPIWTQYDHDVTKIFGRIAELVKAPRPELDMQCIELEAAPSGYVPPEKPAQRYAWARSLTRMREMVTQETVARLCIGGKFEGSKGRFPGLIEEALLSLRARRPLFLVGAFGGATKWVIDHLQSRTPDAGSSVIEQWPEGIKFYEQFGGEPPRLPDLSEEFRSFGKEGLAEALVNGLDNEENQELITAVDPHRIATLVLNGLSRLKE